MMLKQVQKSNFLVKLVVEKAVPVLVKVARLAEDHLLVEAVVVQVVEEAAVLLVVKEEEVRAAEASENSSEVLQMKIEVVNHKGEHINSSKKANQKNSKQPEKPISRRSKL